MVDKISTQATTTLCAASSPGSRTGRGCGPATRRGPTGYELARLLGVWGITSSVNGYYPTRLCRAISRGIGMPFADNNGVRVYYEVEGTGVPLVLQHGYPTVSNLSASSATSTRSQANTS